jgi:nucleoside-diphosphate-sugar epimerase
MTDSVRRRILITGGSGFIGTNLVEHFRELGENVRSLDVNPPRESRHRDLWSNIDLLDAAALSGEVRAFEPDLIIHAAARTDLLGASMQDYRVNTDGTTNLIAAANTTSAVRRVVFFSSRMVCRIGYQPMADDDYCPPNTYGESKVVGEQIVRRSDIRVPWTIVRPTSIWGPWFGVPYRTFFDTVARGRFFHTANSSDVPKSFGFVGNTVYEVARIASATAQLIDRKTFYLADYPPLRLGLWAEIVRRELGAARIRKLPYPLLRLAARAGDLATHCGIAEPPLTTFRLSNLLTPMVYDLAPLERVVGRLPYSLEEGVAHTVAWMRRSA